MFIASGPEKSSVAPEERNGLISKDRYYVPSELQFFGL